MTCSPIAPALSHQPTWVPSCQGSDKELGAGVWGRARRIWFPEESSRRACLFLFPLGEKGLETCRKKGSTAWDFLAELFPARQASEGCATRRDQDLRKLIVLWFGFGMCGEHFFFFLIRECPTCKLKPPATLENIGKILVSHLSLV